MGGRERGYVETKAEWGVEVEESYGKAVRRGNGTVAKEITDRLP